MTSALHPARMSAAERLAEIAEILAAGLVRLRVRKSTPLSRDCGESSHTPKSTDVKLTKSCFLSPTYEIRTKSAKSRGSEKDGRRERILGLRRGAAVQSFVREGQCLLGIFPPRRADREYLVRCDWRRERNRNPTFSGLWINVGRLPVHPRSAPDVQFRVMTQGRSPVR